MCLNCHHHTCFWYNLVQFVRYEYAMSKLRKMTSITVKENLQTLHSQFLNSIPTGFAKQTN